MDVPTPVGSLDAWLPSSVAEPQASRSSPFTSNVTSKHSILWSSQPIPIPGLQSSVGARSAISPDSANCAGFGPNPGAQRRLLAELSGVSLKDATHILVPREGTVRRGRRLRAPPVCSPSTITGFGVTLGPRQHDTEPPAAEALSATSLPLPAAHQVSLTSLCRALSSPAEETGTLACPLRAPPAAVACDGGPTAAEAQQRPSTAAGLALPMSRSAPLGAASSVPAIKQRWERHDRSDCGSTIPCPPRGVNNFMKEGPAAGVVAEPAPARCGPLGRPAAAAAVPLLASCSAKRGLYEGTVRGGCVRNTWRYATCCTAAG
ncbi:hypothetical protein PLESTF_001894900 [Pleodorina starrii]|nr:hypothetical protein PLESTF_001894900 [Pleodorina starrii]